MGKLKISKLRRRTLVRIISYMTAAVFILSGFTFSGYSQAGKYKRFIENEYQYAFAELVSNINGLDSALQKGMYATSPPLLSALSAEVFMRAAAAQMSLGRLPFSEIELGRTSSFLSQAGDFSFALSKKAASHTELSEAEFLNLQALSETASRLSRDLSELQAQINEGQLKISELQNAQSTFSRKQDENIPAGILDTIKSIESEFPEFPNLIYDGPFSAHVSGMEAKYLLDKTNIDANTAKIKAAEFFSLDPSLLEYGGFSDGRVRTYNFNARLDGGEMSVSVTQTGGIILNMFNSRNVKNVKYTPEEAVDIAREFLFSRGFKGMKESYWSVYSNVIAINFAYEQDGVYCYPDLIKVSIALDTGKVTGYDSYGYIMNHKQRDIPEPKIKIENARSKISPGLTLLSENTVIIPTDGMYEIFCYEFKCETEDGRHYILYVNAETGTEERILILIESDTGTLTI